MPVKRVQDLDPISDPIEQTDVTHIVVDGPLGKSDRQATMAELAQAVGRPWNTEFDALHSYNLYEQTFYQGIPYRSLSAANIGNTPDVSPTFWEVTGGGSGGGGLNFIKNPVQKATAANWSKGSGSFVSAPEWSTTKNLYAGGALLLAFTAGTKTANDYFDADFVEIMETFTGISWKIRATIFIDTGATFAADDIAVNYFDGTTETPVNYIPISVLNNKVIFESAMIPTNVIGTTSKLRFRAKLGSTTCVGNLRIADISIAPQVVNSSIRRTGWLDYPSTPVLVGIGTPTISKAEYMIDGDELYCHIKGVSGTSTATEARFPFPAILGGLTSKSDIPTIQAAGSFVISALAAAPRIALIEPNTSYFTIGVVAGGGINAFTKQNGNIIISSGDVFDFWGKCKIAQLSVSVNLSGISDPLNLSNTETVVNIPGVVGKSSYAVEGMAIVANTADNDYAIAVPRPLGPNEYFDIVVRSKIDGSWTRASVASCSVANGLSSQGNIVGASATGFGIVKTTAGQVILRQYKSASAYGASPTLTSWATLIAAADGFDRVKIVASQINASEIPRPVRAKYSNSDAAAINTPINFSNKIEDTHGAVVTGAGVWKFIAPYPGYYIPTLKSNVNVGHTIELSKRGSTLTPSHILAIAFAGAVNYGIPYSEPIWLDAGDWIQVVDTTGTAYASVNNVIDIVKI